MSMHYIFGKSAITISHAAVKQTRTTALKYLPQTFQYNTQMNIMARFG